VKKDADKVFGYFYSRYLARFIDQGLTGKITLSLEVNLFKGSISSFKCHDVETKLIKEISDKSAFSCIAE